MKTRLIRQLQKLRHRRNPDPDHDLPNIEYHAKLDFLPQTGIFNKSRLVVALSCFICLEAVLLWNGAALRHTVFNANEIRIPDFLGISSEYSTYAAGKVGMIMKMYHCHDERIYQAIMDTFDPILVAAMIGIESNYRIDAVSRRGCRGLMQLTPNKLTDWQDPVANIRVGAAYLESLLQRFGQVDLAVAAYNAGPGAIIKYGGVPPFPETLRHVAKARLIGLKSCWPLNNPLITGFHFSFSG